MFKPFDPTHPIHTYAWVIVSADRLRASELPVYQTIVSGVPRTFQAILTRVDITPGQTPHFQPLDGHVIGEGEVVFAYSPFVPLECFKELRLQETAFAHAESYQRVDGEHWAVYTNGESGLLCDIGMLTFYPEDHSKFPGYEFKPYALAGYAPEPSHVVYFVPHGTKLTRQAKAEALACEFMKATYGNAEEVTVDAA